MEVEVAAFCCERKHEKKLKAMEEEKADALEVAAQENEERKAKKKAAKISLPLETFI